MAATKKITVTIYEETEDKVFDWKIYSIPYAFPGCPNFIVGKRPKHCSSCQESFPKKQLTPLKLPYVALTKAGHLENGVVVIFTCKKCVRESTTKLFDFRRTMIDAQVTVFTPCHSCGKISEGTIKKCGRCQFVRYCSEICQRKDWKIHKLSCNQLPEQEDIDVVEIPKGMTVPGNKQVTVTYKCSNCELYLGSNEIVTCSRCKNYVYCTDECRKEDEKDHALFCDCEPVYHF